MKKASEQHIGTLTVRDGVPGAPVTELEYKRAEWYAVLEKVNMATY